MGFKSNFTSASHKDCFYHYLIHASHCQKNFPKVYKTYGVTVQSNIFLFILHSIFKVQVFAQVMDSAVYSYKSNKDVVPVIHG